MLLFLEHEAGDRADRAKRFAVDVGRLDLDGKRVAEKCDHVQGRERVEHAGPLQVGGVVESASVAVEPAADDVVANGIPHAGIAALHQVDGSRTGASTSAPPVNAAWT